jgi:hypothetical protein
MPFVRMFNTLIKKYNKNIIFNISKNNISMQNYDAEFNLLSSKEIVKGNYSFIDAWFDINEQDNTIYGIINEQKNSLLYLYINDKIILKNYLLKYDSDIFSINFLYIKKIATSTHIIYYLIDKHNINQCSIIHHYKENDTWIKTKIDTLNYNILTNFVVIFENSTPTIFYLKIWNGYEEVFTSTFDLKNKNWTPPLQLTNSHKFKVYLSAIKYSTGNYHITYSENNSNRYYCNYINAQIIDNTPNTLINETISKTIACTFPSIISYNGILYIQWIEFDSLNYCISYDLGKTWTKPNLDKISSEHDFYCYSYKSNITYKKQDNFPIIFARDKPYQILGIINEQDNF